MLWNLGLGVEWQVRVREPLVWVAERRVRVPAQLVGVVNQPDRAQEHPVSAVNRLARVPRRLGWVGNRPVRVPGHPG